MIAPDQKHISFPFPPSPRKNHQDETSTPQDNLLYAVHQFVVAAEDGFLPYCAMVAYAWVLNDSFIYDINVGYPIPSRTEAPRVCLSFLPLMPPT